MSSYCRIICGLRLFPLGTTGPAAGARDRAWFCILGRSLSDWAISHQVPSLAARSMRIGPHEQQNRYNRKSIAPRRRSLRGRLVCMIIRNYVGSTTRRRERQARPSPSRPGPSAACRLASRSLVLVDLRDVGRHLRRGEALEAFKQFLFGHPVDGNLRIIGIDPLGGGADERHTFGFWFINFDVFLKRVDEVLFEVARRNGFFCDLA